MHIAQGIGNAGAMLEHSKHAKHSRAHHRSLAESSFSNRELQHATKGFTNSVDASTSAVLFLILFKATILVCND